MSRIEPTKLREPLPETQRMLDSLTRAVHDALERKRRLGQYAVIWRDGRPVAIGDDAPSNRARKRINKPGQPDLTRSIVKNTPRKMT